MGPILGVIIATRKVIWGGLVTTAASLRASSAASQCGIDDPGHKWCFSRSTFRHVYGSGEVKIACPPAGGEDGSDAAGVQTTRVRGSGASMRE
ncbi:hypothetical protein MRX96_011977 [Rhipicephalus microplus]